LLVKGDSTKNKEKKENYSSKFHNES
jgi:hypothetical protein